MYSKIISPQKHGSVIYNNKGSALRLGNYLEKEQTKNVAISQEIFFNADGNFTKEQMVEAIDGNIKGLKIDDDKFHSLVIAPSADELKYIGNDPQKLKEFTIACMDKYASNFRLGKGKSLSEKDLIWFATIHNERSFKGTDKEVLEGIKKSGDLKAGLQTHIHIVVSARDKEQKITLNPNTSNKNRFLKTSWFDANQRQFNQQFSYSADIKFNNPSANGIKKSVVWVEKKIQELEKIGVKEEQIKELRQIGSEKKHSLQFRENLGVVVAQLKSKKDLSKDELNLVMHSSKDVISQQKIEKNIAYLAKFPSNKNIVEQLKLIAEKKDFSYDFSKELQNIATRIRQEKKFSEKIVLPKELKTLEKTTKDTFKIELAERALQTLEKRFHLNKSTIAELKQIGKDSNFSSDYLNNLRTLIDNKTENQGSLAISSEQLNLLKTSKLDATDSKEHFVNIQLSFLKTKLEFKDCEHIKKIAIEKEFSHDFREKLSDLVDEIKSRKVEIKPSELEKILCSASQSKHFDKIEKLLDKLSYSENDLQKIREIAENKHYSKDFEDKLRTVLENSNLYGTKNLNQNAIDFLNTAENLDLKNVEKTEKILEKLDKLGIRDDDVDTIIGIAERTSYSDDFVKNLQEIIENVSDRTKNERQNLTNQEFKKLSDAELDATPQSSFIANYKTFSQFFEGIDSQFSDEFKSGNENLPKRKKKNKAIAQDNQQSISM